MNYLIDEKFLKEVTSISTNKNGMSVDGALRIVTARKIKRFLTPDLYALYAAYVNDEQPVPLTPKQADLFELIQLFMAILVEREMLFNFIDNGNKGPVSDEQVASMELINAKVGDLKAKAATFETDILDYLAENAADFPEYKPKKDGDPATKRPINTLGIILDIQPKRWYE